MWTVVIVKVMVEVCITMDTDLDYTRVCKCAFIYNIEPLSTVKDQFAALSCAAVGYGGIFAPFFRAKGGKL